MLIKSEFDIQFQFTRRTAMLAMLHLHPSMEPYVRSGNELSIEQLETGAGRKDGVLGGISEYLDSFGNRCSRFIAPAGGLRLFGESIVDVDGLPDPSSVDARQAAVEDLPPEVLQFLLPSRYCEVDLFVSMARKLFDGVTAGWERAVAIRDWVHQKVRFDYRTARPTKTAMDAFDEGVGVCRDFQHLAIALSRCQNIPARYATGYLGDIRWPYCGPGDFSAWYQVWLEGRWWTMDARQNQPRVGRILMATGRDAADVAMTTSFGNAELKLFHVESNQINEDGTVVPPLPVEVQAGVD